MNTSSEPAWLARALRPFTRVEQGEAVTALLLSVNVFLLLCAYYVIKPVREALILELSSGAEYKAYMSGVVAALLLVIVPLYAKLVDRLSRVRLVTGVTLGFALQIVGFFAAMSIESLRSELGLIFYAWVGVFNMMVVAQFWGYANDLYTPEQGERLIPMVAVGASLGAAVGSQFAALLIPLLGVPAMLLVAATLLAGCAGLYVLVERRSRSGRDVGERAAKPVGSGRGGAFQLVLSHRYLLLIALFSWVFTWVNSNGEYMLSKLIKADALAAVDRGVIAAAEQGRYIGAAYAQFFFQVNVAGVLLQAFVVSRLVKWLGLPKAFLVLPLLALVNASVVAVVPVLLFLQVGKVAENATDYSLNNTLRHMLWLVTSADMKYKAKQAIDTFFVRSGDVCSALSVWLFAATLLWPVERFAWVSIALIAVWLLIALAIGRAHRQIERDHGLAPS